MATTDGVVTLLPPPEGYVVNFDNPTRQGEHEAYYVAGFGLAISFLFFMQRMYVKIFLAGGLQIDDILLIFSYILAVTTVAFCVHMFAHGAGGVHAWEIPIETFNIYVKDVYLSACIYVLCGSFAKLALLIFYLRLSPQRWFKWAVWTAIAIICIYTVVLFCLVLFACKPMAMNWDITVTDGICINQTKTYIATAAVNIISDVFLFVLPLPMVFQLQLPAKQKIGLMGIFTIGSLTVITSIVRVSLLPSMMSSMDLTWTIAYPSIWIIVEANLIITCATMPTLRKFFKHVAPKLIGESRYGSKSGKSSKYGKPEISSKPSSRGLVPGSQHRRNRTNYSQFDDEQMPVPDEFALAPIKGVGHNTVVGHSDENVMGWMDSDSEKGIVEGTIKPAIVQTKTVTVEYER
ncbi:related to integral membrane protein [Fusarium torulosum]|uniref:Related to integral membrane protein n=1 Tax=Fusarium torulosum TaxID=33205 RepID=A0AAE8M1I7_9HYPO|nr:related to integral membrane protein [Fusarium torulosum]